MRYLFLLVGFFLIVGGGVILFARPGQPQPIELFAMLFIIGGFVLLGVAQILKSVTELKAGKP